MTMTNDSERLVPRDLPQDDEVDSCAKALREAIASGGKPWQELGESERGWYSNGAKAVLEAAGVERLRAELESCRSVNAALTTDIEGWKHSGALQRKIIDGIRAAWDVNPDVYNSELVRIAQAKEGRIVSVEKDRDQWHDAAVRAEDGTLWSAIAKEQKARADRAEADGKKHAELLARELRVTHSRVNALEAELHQRVNECSTLRATVRLANERIDALGKAARKAADAARLITYNQETQERVDNNGAFRSAMVGLRVALDSAQPAPDRKFCGISFEEFPDPATGEPRYRRIEPAPDARDETTGEAAHRTYERHVASPLPWNRTEVWGDVARAALDAAKPATDAHYVPIQFGVGDPRARVIALEAELTPKTERILELEAVVAGVREAWDLNAGVPDSHLPKTAALKQERIDRLLEERNHYERARNNLKERIRVACAELRKLEDNQQDLFYSIERIARELGAWQSLPRGSRHPVTGEILR